MDSVLLLWSWFEGKKENLAKRKCKRKEVTESEIQLIKQTLIIRIADTIHRPSAKHTNTANKLLVDKLMDVISQWLASSF